MPPPPPAPVRYLVDWLEDGIGTASECGDSIALLRFARDRALVLFGHYMACPPAELCHLRVEQLRFSAIGLVLRRTNGRICILPRADTRFCPVAAVQLWITLAGLSAGYLFRCISPHNGRLARSLSAEEAATNIERLLMLAGAEE